MEQNFEYGLKRRSIIILQSQQSRASDFHKLAQMADCLVIATIDPADPGACEKLRAIGTADFILSDLCSETEHHHAALLQIATYLNEYGTAALLWIGDDQIDLAYSALPAPQCDYFVGASLFEALPILSEAVRPMKLQQLAEGDAKTDFGALHRISDELADFARTLARIAEGDEGDEPRFNDKPVSFRPAPAAIFETMTPKLVATAPTVAAAVSAGSVRALIKQRRKRERFFDKDLFADPAWDIMLDLFAARLEGTKVSVSSLCIAAAVPSTTALRWISAMTENGMLQREQDPNDARRVFITLSAEAVTKLSDYFAEAGLAAI